MKYPVYLLLGAALVLPSCGGEFPESVPKDELPVYNLVITEAIYNQSENYLIFYCEREDGYDYDRLAENYKGSQGFDIVRWITVPDENYFSVRSGGNLAYLHDGFVAPDEIGFDTSKPVYLFKEEEYNYGIPGWSLVPDEYEMVFAKGFIITESIAITRND